MSAGPAIAAPPGQRRADRTDRVDGRRRPWRSTGPALALLALLYVAVIVAGDARAASGSDAGGKLATVAVMAEHGTVDPDLGYWAEATDPDGRYHPLWNTVAIGDRWIQATSLPFVVAATPLYALAGPHGALLLPVLGGLVAALAARRLSHQLHGGEGWAAFWLVGAAGPALFYAGDFWEHAPALGLALLAISLALDAEDPWRAALAGLCGGVAVVLRAEMLLYGVALGVSCLAVAEERRRWLRRPRLVASLVAGAAVPVLANAMLERLLLDGGVRDARAAESVASGGHEAATRVVDALVTSFGLFPSDDPVALAYGAALVGCLIVAAVHLARPASVTERAAVGALVGAGLLYAFRFVGGPGFVPGFLVVVPLAVVGATVHRTPRQRVVLGTAIGVLPLVWLLAWSGNHLAQWGGRYLLLSGALLCVLAVGACDRVGWRRPPVVAFVGLTVAVALVGATWHVQRTRTVADAVATIEQLPDDVVVLSTLGHLGREGGDWYGDHRWLRADRARDLAPAAATARAAGADRVAVVLVVPAGEVETSIPTLDGFRRDGEAVRAPYLGGQHLLVVPYEVTAQGR